MRRRFDHHDYPAERLAAERELTVSVLLPAKDEERTVGEVVGRLMELVEAGVVDQVLVADDSRDDTAARARAAGADVVAQADVLPEHGPVRGKGDAMWRALAAARAEIVCFLDADTRDFSPHFACGLLGPLLCERHVELVKGAYRRPFDSGRGTPQPDGGGRVTELTALPLLRRFRPELAWLRQPLAGEIAAPRELLAALPFTCGYGVDVGLLLDVAARCGAGAVAEVDLDVRQNRHRPLSELGAMADEVLGAVCARLVCDGTLAGDILPSEVPVRPPLRSLALEVA